MDMPQNMGTTDRLARLVIAAAAVGGSLGVGDASAAGIVLLVVAAIMALTSAAGFCPLYVPIRLSTRRHGIARA
jgi:hypothetical protein